MLINHCVGWFCVIVAIGCSIGEKVLAELTAFVVLDFQSGRGLFPVCPTPLISSPVSPVDPLALTVD
jgi:hypothetical protein